MKKSLLGVLIIIVFIAGNQLRVSAQGVYTFCNTATSTTDTVGTIYDSGGPSGDYQVNENCTLLVAPSCATRITLTMHAFDSEFRYDSLHVYDGPTTASPEVMYANDTTITENPVVCNSGYMLIIWHSDVSINSTGFHGTWTSVVATGPPVTNFSMSTTNAPYGVNVQFMDQSSGVTAGWIWFFGDGDTAMSMNPQHAYTTPGTYPVTLISTSAVSCSYSDTASQMITVQDPPNILVTPPTGFSDSVACGDSATFNMYVQNTAGGQLVFNTDGTIVGKIKVLAMSYGTNLFTGISNVEAAIHTYFTNDTIIRTNTANPGTLSGQLVGMNVLLIPEQETGDPNVWIGMGPVIRQFVSNGGSVIFCGSYSSEADCMFNTGIFSGTYSTNAEGNTIHAVNLTDRLTLGLTSLNFQAPEASWAMTITNNDKVTVVNYNGNDVVTYRYYGSGKAIFIAFDYFDTNPDASRIIANAVEWGGENALPPWIHMNIHSDTVNAGDTSVVAVSLVASGMPAGTYYANIGVASNDPDSPLVIVPCVLTVSGLPIIALSDQCLNFGSVMQDATLRDTFKIYNNGCDTLKFNSITSNNPSFTVNGNVPFLLPGAFADIVVTLHDSVVHTVTGAILIDNNDQDTSVCLSATITPAPKFTSSVASVTQPIQACGDSASTTFSISNTGLPGAIALTWSLGSVTVPWLSVSPTSGSIPQGGNITLTLNFGSGTLVGGPRTFNLVVSTNDPAIPSKVIPITIDINFNPCISYSVVGDPCTGVATFSSSSINVPSTYHWDFGDNDTTGSTLANPMHSYQHSGTYNVTLIASNASGADTASQSHFALITGPRPINCHPLTTNYVAGIGIRRFQVQDAWTYRFDKQSPDAVDGYKDYTCTDNATLVTNFPYIITVTTGVLYVETVKMWLDMNNDGTLDEATELLYESDSTLTTHGGTFVIPSQATTVYGDALRLRISSDYSGMPVPLPCANLENGQAEDYSVFLEFYDGVSEPSLETSFIVYPNPFDQNSTIQYSLKKSAEVSIEIFDVLGSQVANLITTEQQNSGSHKYEITGLTPGAYFVKMTVDGKTGIRKIIKM